MSYPWASVGSSGSTKVIKDSSQRRARVSADGIRQSSRGGNRLGEALCPLETARAVGTVVRWHGVARHKGGRRWGRARENAWLRQPGLGGNGPLDEALRREGDGYLFRAPEGVAGWVDLGLPRWSGLMGRYHGGPLGGRRPNHLVEGTASSGWRGATMCDESSVSGSCALHSAGSMRVLSSGARRGMMSRGTPLNACGWWSCECFCDTHSKSVETENARA